MKNPLTKFNRKLRRGIFTLTPKLVAFVMMVSLLSSFSFGSNVAYAAETTSPTVTAPTSTAQTLKGGSTSTSTVSINETGTVYMQRNGTGTLTTRSYATDLTGLAITGGTVSGYTFSGSTYLYSSVTTTASSVTVTPTYSAGSVTVNGSSVSSGIASGSISLSGTTSITVVVSETAKTDRTYVLKVTQASAPTATGTYTTDSSTVPGYYITRFTGNGTYTPPGSTTADILVIGAGGAGGRDQGKGGDAGDYSYNTGVSLTGTQKTVTVGTGGKWVNYNTTVNGGSSSITNTGSGGATTISASGGVVEGSGYITSTGGLNGNNIGDGYAANANGNGVPDTGNPGGAGISNSITGTAKLYAAGGRGCGTQGNALCGASAYTGGSAYVMASGGYYTGNNNPHISTTAGAGANTGSGASAESASQAYAPNGLQGADGVVIIKVPAAAITPTQAIPTFSNSFSGSSVTTTITSSGADAIYYTTDGTDPATSVTGSTSLYSSPISVGAKTVKAIAVKSGYSNSPIGIITYAFNWTTDIAAGNAFIARANGASGTSTVLIPTSPVLNDGLYNIIGVDTAGNTSNTLSGWLTVDNTADAAPGTPDMTSGTDTGSSSTDNITSNATPSFTMSCVSGSTVTLYDNVTSIGSGACSSSTVTITASTLTAGTHSSINAKQTDAAGNISAASSNLSVEIDTTAPTAPTSVTFTPVGGTVVSNALNGTNTNFTASATITAGQATGGTATLLKGGSAFSSTIQDTSIAGGDTSVSFTAGAANNAAVQAAFATGATLSVQLCDAAGNCSTSSVSNPTITVDYTADAAPGTPDMTSGTDTGSSSTDNITSNATPSFTMSCVSGSTVTLYDNVTSIGSGACSSSTVTITASTLTAGTHSSINAKQTDAAGNISAASSNLSVEIDTTIPTLSLVSLSSTTNADPLYSKVGDTIQLTFTASETVSTPSVAFSISGYSAYNADVVSSTGGLGWQSVFNTSSNDADGNITYSISFSDTAGNAGVAVTSGSGSVLFDKTAPTAGAVTDPATTPVYQATTGYTVTYTSGSDVGGSGLHATPYTLTTYSTSGACNSRTEGTLLGTDTASPYNATLQGGNNYIGIAFMDKAGNLSYACSDTFVNVDDTAPEVAPSNLTTTTINGNYTGNNTPLLTWDAATDSGSGLHATNSYYIDMAQTVDFSGVTSTTVTSNTNSYTPSALASGTWYFKVKAKDAAGNYSTYSNTLNIFVDTTAPNTSAIDTICGGSNSCTAGGVLASPQEAYSVNNITGTASDNTNGSGVQTVEISIQDRGTDNITSGNYFGGSTFDSSTENYIAATYNSGSWSYDSSSILFEIDHYYLINIRATDSAGNIESPDVARNFKFTNEPPTISITGSTTENSSGVLSVTFTTSDSGSVQTSNTMFYRSGLTLGANITSPTSTSAITLSTTVPSYFPSAGSVLIDDEIITYTEKSGSTLTGITRGTAVNGNVGDRTTKATHTAGAVIYVYAASATGDGLSNIGSGKTISWTVSDDAPGYQYDSSAPAPAIKIVVNDGASGNMLATATADIDLDAAAASMTSSSMLIDSSASAVESIDPAISLSLAAITGIPSTETIYVQFSRDNTNWYGANSDNTLATLASLGTGFAANTAAAKSWPWTMATRDETIYVKITDAFGNVSVGDSNTVSYNAAPEFDSSFGGGNGIIVDQISDTEAGGSDVLGTVKIQYRIKDSDVDDTTITPTFQYDPAGGTNWTTVSLPSAGTSVTSSGYTTHTVYWTPTAESVSTSTASFKVTIDDGHTTNSSASSTDSSVVIDTTKPSSGMVTFDAGVGGLSDSGLITITKPTDVSALKYRIQDSNTNSTPVDTSWVTITESTTIPWTLDSDEEIKSVIYNFKDIYGNETTETTTTTLAPISADTFLIQDTSNINVSPLVNQLYVSWQQLSAPATGFDSYVLEYSYSTNGSTYSNYAAVPDPLDTLSAYSTNYYIHKDLTATYYYKYRLGVKNTAGNTSMRVGESILAKPDGSPNYGEGAGSSVNASVVENVIPIQDSDTKDVTITYKLTDSTNNNKTNPNYDARIFYNVGTVLGSSPLVDSTTIKLSSTAKLKSSGYIKINNEILKYTGISGNNLTGVTRATWADDTRATRTNGNNLLAGTPVWVMATNTSNNAITDVLAVSNSTIKNTGYNGSIVWTVYNETALAGSLYTTLPIQVLVHDGQDALSAPLSSQSDYSETGTLNDFDLTAPTIGFSTTTSSGSESATPATFTLSLARAYPLNSTVSYAVTGTATGSGTDYTLADGTATITAGQTSANIEAVINNDSIKEGDEDIVITISSPANAILGANTVHTYTITDDDNAPVIAFDATASSGLESTTSVNIPISINAVSGTDITVSYAVTGTATGSGTDYTLANGTATITAGQTTTNISPVIINDQSYEGDETVVITISSPNGATLGANTVHTYTITNEDSAPVISFSSSASSGLESATTVNIPVSINFASYQNTSVDYTITGGTATGSGTDYTLANGTATITAGQTTTNISITVADDVIDEIDETIEITLSPSPVNSTLGSTTVHTYTITDNDTSTTVGFDTTSSSGSESVSAIDIPVSISASSGLDVTVSYAITGTATGSGTDYTLANGTATITAGQTTTNISITVADDVIDEIDETIIITLSSPNNASLTANTIYTYTITDNDNAPTVGFTTDNGTSIENATPAAKTIPVSISAASGKSITVAYTITTNGTATLNSDFTATNTTGTLTIAPGSTTANIPFTVINDATFEQDETIIVTLATPSNATLGTSTYTYTITNDDVEADTTAPIFTFDADQGITTISTDVYSVDVVKGALFSFPTYTVSDNVTATESITVAVSTDTISTTNVTTTPIVVTYTVQDGATPKNTKIVTLRVNVVLAASYTVTVTAGTNGVVDADATTKALIGYSVSNNVYTIPRVNATTGNNATFDITPDSGFNIDTLIVDGVTLASDSSVLFTNVIANHTIDVTFTATLDTTAPEITLLGSSELDVILGNTYTDDGITAVEDNNVSCTEGSTSAAPQSGCRWSKSGTVNTSAVSGNTPYKIIYKAINAQGLISTAERIVNVVYADTYTLTLTVTGSGSVKDTLGNTVSAGSVVLDSLSTPEYVFEPATDLHKVKTLSVTIGGTTTPLNVDDYQAGYTFSQIKGNVSLAVSFGLINEPIPVIAFDSSEVNLALGGTYPTTDWDAYIYDIDGVTMTQLVTDGVAVANGVTFTITGNSTATGVTGAEVLYTVVYTGGVDGTVTGTATRTLNITDNVAPVISNITEPVIKNDVVMVSWSTDEKANTRVYWDTSSRAVNGEVTEELLADYTYFSDLRDDDVKQTTHWALMDTLTATTTYYYVVVSVDGSGNKAISAEQQVDTVEAGEVVIVSSGGGSSGIALSVYEALQKELESLRKNTLAGMTSTPTISNVKISDVNAFGATLSFDTDRLTVVGVDYGKTKEFGKTEGSFKWGTEHKIKIGGLTVGTDYYFKINALDKYGNVGTIEEGNQVFKTKFFSENLPERKSIDDIEQFQAEIESTIESILPSLVAPFVQAPEISEITEDSAIVKFKTNIKSYTVVGYSSDSYYQSISDENTTKYNGEVSDTTEKTLNHSLQLIGLKPNTKYHVIAKAFSLPQVIGKSEDVVFTTKPAKIVASVAERKKDSFTIVWNTSGPTSSIVDYKNNVNGNTGRSVDAAMNTSHSMKIENLTPGTNYTVNVSGVNNIGNTVEAVESLSITTSTDVTAPVISRIKVDSALVLGRTDKTQTIISWKTDEPSTSVVYYEEGSGSPDKPLANKQEDNELTLNHTVMLTTLRPGQVYRFQIASSDDANNISKLPVRTIITPRPNESIVDVIFKNFNETFNFINNVR